MEKKRALIAGINGQDGSSLAEHLLGHDDRVTGLVRRARERSHERLAHPFDDRAGLALKEVTGPLR